MEAARETFARADHPLLPSTDTGNVTIKNRPRFTLAEAITLNLIVNAGEDGVGIGKIQETVGMVSFWGRPHKTSVLHTVAQIRAKLGEKRRHPTQLVNVMSTINPRQVVGFRWVES